MMTDNVSLPSYKGSGSQRLAFSDIDLRFELKIRAFIEIAMPPIFMALEKEFSLFKLREDGIAPIMFFLDFQAEPLRVAFGRPVESEHTIKIFRQQRQHADGTKDARLIMDMSADFFAHEGASGKGSLGYEPEKGARQYAGSAKVLQVLSRPMAPRGNRNLDQLPEALERFQLHNWEGPFPDLAFLQEPPQGFQEVPKNSWGENRSIWGMPNTDINQHVNVQEYIRGSEDHFTRQIFGAGLPVPEHRINRGRLLFRKPFFPGQPYVISATLYTQRENTVYIGGFHSLDAHGSMEPQPNIMVRMEGNIRGK